MAEQVGTYPHDDAALMDEVIRRHCEWLNLWCAEWASEERASEERGEVHLYRPTDFDEATNRWGFRRLDGTVLNETGETLTMVFTISDGDDGGPTTITAWYEVDLEGFYSNAVTGETSSEPDWTKAADLRFSHHVHRGWLLRDAVREFDTDRTMWLRGGELVELPDELASWGVAPKDSEATLS